MKNILSIAYFPSIQWFSKIIEGNFEIEIHENYSKGSYRNRCHILSANGVQHLSIPLVSGKHQQTNIKEVRISNDSDWQRQHWQSIISAYGKAPFFPFYGDEIKELVFNSQTLLFAYNVEIIQGICELIQVSFEEKFTSEFSHTYPEKDFRNSISPKKKFQKSDVDFKIIPYGQVFEYKFGFTPNLSILDLLFCLGPETQSILAP